jgi:hypothetical protein
MTGNLFKNCIIVELSRGYTVAFTKVLTIYEIFHIWIHPLHHSPCLPSIPGIVSTGIIFPLINICTQYLYYIHSPTPSAFPPPTGIKSSGRTYSALLFSNFVKEKKIWFAFPSKNGQHFFFFFFFFFFFWPFGLPPLKKFFLVQLPTSLLVHWFWGNLVFF